MANNQNLKPLNKRPQRERKEIARLGAAASNKAQANKRALRESAKLLLSLPVDEKTKLELKRYNLFEKDYNYAMALVSAQVKNALQGDTKAFNAIRDIVGESPQETKQEEIGNDDKIINIKITPATVDDIESN